MSSSAVTVKKSNAVSINLGVDLSHKAITFMDDMCKEPTIDKGRSERIQKSLEKLEPLLNNNARLTDVIGNLMKEMQSILNSKKILSETGRDIVYHTATLINQNESMKVFQNEEQKKLGKLEKLVTKLTAENETLKSKLKTATSDLTTAQTRNSDTNDKMSKLTTDHAIQSLIYQNDIEKDKKLLEELAEENKVVKNRLITAEKDTPVLKSKIEHLSSTIKEKEVNLAAIQKKLNDLTNTHTQLKIKSENQALAFKNQGETILKLQQELQSEKAERNKTTVELQNLQIKLTQESSDLQRAKTDLQQAQTDLTQRNLDLQQALTKLGQTELDLQKSRLDNRNGNNLYEALLEERNTLLRRLGGANGNIKQLSDSLLVTNQVIMQSAQNQTQSSTIPGQQYMAINSQTGARYLVQYNPNTGTYDVVPPHSAAYHPNQQSSSSSTTSYHPQQQNQNPNNG